MKFLRMVYNSESTNVESYKQLELFKRMVKTAEQRHLHNDDQNPDQHNTVEPLDLGRSQSHSNSHNDLPAIGQFRGVKHS